MEVAHPATLGSLRSRTISWLEVGGRVLDLKPPSQSSTLLGLKSREFKGIREGQWEVK